MTATYKGRNTLQDRLYATAEAINGKDTVPY
jgi:hypothetical protein